MKFLTEHSAITPSFLEEHILPHIPVQTEKARVLDIGCENFAIDFGPIIVRLPSEKIALKKLHFEHKVCDLVNLTSLKTPRTEIVDAAYPFSWHEKIPGDYLLPEYYEELSEAQRHIIADQLSHFFETIHALPMNEMVDIGAEKLPDYMPHQIMEKIVKNNSAIIPQDLSKPFHTFLDKYEALAIEPEDISFGYFDAHGWNMAFDKPAGELIGIYDFADCGFGDIHQDFHPLNTISQDLVQRVVSAYQQRTNKTVDLKKVNFYTVLAEYSELFEVVNGQQTLMQKDLNHHLSQIRRWQETIEF